MRLWGDGFDHYGDDETNMLDGSYATASNVTLTTAQFANGTHSVLIGASGTSSNSGGLRKVLASAKDKMGASARFYFPDMPTDNLESCLFEFLTSSTTMGQIAVVLDANGRLGFYRGSSSAPLDGGMSGTLVAQTDPIVVASAWNHIEIQVYIHDSAGWVRVAINGVHRYESTGLDTKHNADNIVSVRTCRYEVATQSGEFYIDDYSLYDFTGTAATDTDWCPTVDGSGVATNYIGELQPILCLATADTAEADWLKSTGTDGYDLIDKTTPNDATYIYSTTATDLSEFTLTDLPADITYIRGVDFHSRISKSDSGAAMYKVGMKSVAATSDATEIPMTVEPTYWYAQINVDPDSTTRWTRPSFNAAWLRQLRSA